MWIVRTTGDSEPLQWSGVGPQSIGIYSIPLLQPLRLKDFNYRSPSADGNAHTKNAGSKRETVNLKTKKIHEILGDIRRVFHTLTFLEFPSLGEATHYCATGKTYRDLLGVTDTTTPEELKALYKFAASANHPDKFMHDPDKVKIQTERLAAITAAYEALK